MSEASGGIVLATINAKWIHPSLALRVLKANLGALEERCAIMEFALRQPLREKTEPILAARPRILGLSVSIWNHAATLELLKELRETWDKENARPVVVLGGCEVSHLAADARVFQYADFCIKGEGEDAFRELCEKIMLNGNEGCAFDAGCAFRQADISAIKSGYGLYSLEDLRKKLTYVEASRGCPFSCAFCQSAGGKTREFPLEPFLEEMRALVGNEARTFKFLDRSFNVNAPRAKCIMEFFLAQLEQRAQRETAPPFTVHFEMVPFLFSRELIETIARFPLGSLRLEIGIQTLNPEVSALIGRPAQPECELETLRALRRETSAIIHADLIAGLPGEDMDSFAKGFDMLWDALCSPASLEPRAPVEVQLGILKILPGAPIARRVADFGMRFRPEPPYEITQTAALRVRDLDKIKNFARFWEIIVNRGLADIGASPVFEKFMALSDSLLARFGRNWGIDKAHLLEALRDLGFGK